MLWLQRMSCGVALLYNYSHAGLFWLALRSMSILAGTLVVLLTQQNCFGPVPDWLWYNLFAPNGEQLRFSTKSGTQFSTSLQPRRWAVLGASSIQVGNGSLVSYLLIDWILPNLGYSGLYMNVMHHMLWTFKARGCISTSWFRLCTMFLILNPQR